MAESTPCTFVCSFHLSRLNGTDQKIVEKRFWWLKNFSSYVQESIEYQTNKNFTFWRCRAVNAAVPAGRLIIREVAVTETLGPNLGCCSVRQVEVLGVVDSVWKMKREAALHPNWNEDFFLVPIIGLVSCSPKWLAYEAEIRSLGGFFGREGGRDDNVPIPWLIWFAVKMIQLKKRLANESKFSFVSYLIHKGNHSFGWHRKVWSLTCFPKILRKY